MNIRRTTRTLPTLAILLASVFLLRAGSLSVVTNIIGSDRFTTPYFKHDSGKPGPTLMIVGGAHGDEPAGAAAAETIRHWPITSGKLVVIPRSNVPALEIGKRYTPGHSTNLSNLNRNYPHAGRDEPPRAGIATDIWQLALEHKPDWLLDLHEGFDFHQINSKSVGSSVIVFPIERGLIAADLMLAAVNETITEPKLKFVRRDMPIDGSLARAGGEHLKIPSMTLETTSKQAMTKRVRQHEIMVHALLRHVGMIGDLPAPTFIEPQPALGDSPAAQPARTSLRVALYKGPGTGGSGPPSLMKRLNNPPVSSITQITPDEIRAGVLTNYDVAIFGGGSGSKQAEALGEEGRENVKQFVARGGGYIGICAGAYLATSGYPWSLGLINARTVSPKWQRGKTTVKLELTESGESILGERDGQFDCRYANGPIVKPDTRTNLPPFETLAFYRSEVSSNGAPAGVMIDSPAIFRAQFEKGRVVCVSPHPEQTSGLEEVVPNAINWVAPREKIVSNKPVHKAE